MGSWETPSPSSHSLESPHSFPLTLVPFGQWQRLCQYSTPSGKTTLAKVLRLTPSPFPLAMGTFLVAGLALIVTLTGEGLWKIVAYILHQVGAKGSDMDIQHLEHQVILRNQAMPFDSILEFSKIAWTWRHSRLRPLRRAFGLMFWPLIILMGFSLASVFSANVSKPAYEVNRILLESNACGLLMPSIEDQQTEKGRFETHEKYMKDMRQSRAYAEECYRGLHGSALCNDFASARLPYTIQQEVTCPFGNRCLLGRSGAVRPRGFPQGDYLLGPRHSRSHGNFDGGGNRPRAVEYLASVPWSCCRRLELDIAAL